MMSSLSMLHISHIIVESLLLTLSRKIFARNPCYESPFTLEQNDVIALLSVFFNFEYTSHIALVLLLLILSIYLIAGFDISYFSYF